MKINILINNIGYLEVQCKCECKGIQDIKFNPDELILKLRCRDCYDYWYDEDRKEGHFYCAHTEQTIKDINKIPIWCHKYKHLLETFQR